VNDICYINAIYRLIGAQAKRLIGRPQEALLCAKAKRQQPMFYLRESEASAANVLTVRKRSDSGKCFLCDSGKYFLCESEASATNVLTVRKRSDSNKCFNCAKAKRQQQMFSARKRSGSGKYFLCESEATATNVLTVRKRSDSNQCFICAKAKRQQPMFYLRESEASAANVLTVRKRSANEATATNVLTVRKRSGSNKMFYLCESVVLTKRQQQSAQPERKSTTRYVDEQ